MSLGEKDLREVLTFLAEAAAVEGDHPFPECVVERLNDLIGGDAAASRRMNRLTLELEVGTPSPVWHGKTFLFSSDRDFGEPEREILDVLQPHLVALERQSEIRRLAVRALAVLERVDEDSNRGFVLLDQVGLVDAVSPRAQALLGSWFGPSTNGRLPEELDGWLCLRRRSAAPQQRAVPFELLRGAHALAVDLVDDDVLVVEERRVQPEARALTIREHEVLECVAEGMSNKEIAAFFSISPGTVSKHLEHVYAKLGVRSRTAAVARLRGRALPVAAA